MNNLQVGNSEEGEYVQAFKEEKIRNKEEKILKMNKEKGNK